MTVSDQRPLATLEFVVLDCPDVGVERSVQRQVTLFPAKERHITDWSHRRFRALLARHSASARLGALPGRTISFGLLNRTITAASTTPIPNHAMAASPANVAVCGGCGREPPFRAATQ